MFELGVIFQGSTVFFITHRLTTIRSADIILMMDSGSLVEQGSHQDLLDLEVIETNNEVHPVDRRTEFAFKRALLYRVPTCEFVFIII